MSELNIFQRMSAITTELQTVAKNLTVEMQKGKGYKAVGEVDVLNAVKPLEAKYRIYSYPVSTKIIETKELTKTTQYGESISQFLRVERTYRFVNIDKPEEYIEVQGYGDGVDTQDKAPGKAITYADKYCLLKAYKISTGDDPDQSGSEEGFKNKSAISKQESAKLELITQDQINIIMKLYTAERIEKMLNFYSIKTIKEMKYDDALTVISKAEKEKHNA